jgi:hypothetical protein
VKDFILYRQPVRESQFENREYNLNELETFPGTSQLAELEVVKGGTLKTTSDVGPYRVFEFSCEYYGPKPRVSPTPPLMPAKFELWQCPERSLIISFDPPRKVSRVAVALLSLASFRDPSLILPLKIFPSDFLELKKRVEKLDGTLSQLILHNVSSSGVELRQVQFIGRRLERLPNIDGMLTGAADISCLGFIVPGFGEGGRRFSFRVVEWGGGQIYSPPDPLPHEISDFLDLFETTLAARQPPNPSQTEK